MHLHHLILTGWLAAAWLLAAPPVGARAATDLIVHEWGTFTVRFDTGGVPVKWRPLQPVSDLPQFVHLANSRVTRKNTIPATVRIETPVLYFYAGIPLTLSVGVGFPGGVVTEWYPRARRTRRGIRWPRVTVLPGATATLPREEASSHYYPARETDAALVRVRGAGQTEHEKFLFYRGVGTFDLPLSARLDGDDVRVRNLGPDPIGRIIVFENGGAGIGFRAGDLSTGEVVLPRPVPEPGALAGFESDLQAQLQSAGLYEREARAMIETWRSTWAEAGLRVLYILPRRLTDAVLPLTIDPAPTTVVRVLVGRGEVWPPSVGIDP